MQEDKKELFKINQMINNYRQKCEQNYKLDKKELQISYIKAKFE